MLIPMIDKISAVALIGDVVKSRASGDRAALQRELVEVLQAVNALEPAEQALTATIGDEFQGVYLDVRAALRATLLLRLTLPEGLDCRFGLGAGQISVVGRSPYGLTQDGSAWWSAREAIEEAKRREDRRNRSLRTWFVASPDAPAPVADPALVNAALLARDEIVTAMNARSRRLTRGHLLGQTQRLLAEQEGITQGAVSQNLRSSGGLALIAGHELMGS